MTPFMVQYGQAEHIREQRKQELMDAYNALKERFVRGISSPELLPEAVWINTPPQTKKEETELLRYILTESASFYLTRSVQSGNIVKYGKQGQL